MSSEDGKVDPKVMLGLQAAKNMIPATPGERLRFEFVVDAKGEIKVSFPPPQMEGEFWKLYIHMADFAKAYYAEKRSPLSI